MRGDEIQSRGRAKQLRRTMTKAEVLLWAHLRRNAMGAKFRRQHPIGPYIADFACVERMLVVEVDGATHATPEERTHDRVRTALLNAQGWRVLRVQNSDVYENLDGVWRTIEAALSHPPP